MTASLLNEEKDIVHFTKRYQHKNGKIIWADVSTSLRRDDEGKPLYFMTSLIDITSKKAAEEELIISETRYRSLVEFSPIAIMVNHTDTVTYVNQACIKLFGAKTADQLVGHSISDLFIEEGNNGLKENFRRLSDLGEIMEPREEKILRLDGSVLIVDVSASAVSRITMEYINI